MLQQPGPWHEQARIEVILSRLQRDLVTHSRVVVLDGVYRDVAQRIVVHIELLAEFSIRCVPCKLKRCLLSHVLRRITMDCHGIRRLYRRVESVALSTVYSNEQAVMENVDSCRPCDYPERFHLLDAEHASSLSTTFETKHERLPHHANRFLTFTHFQISLPLLQTRQNSSQIRTSWRHKPTASTSNLHVIPKLPISTLSFSIVRLPGAPASHGTKTQVFTTTLNALQDLSEWRDAHHILTS